jgi:hypothetical protein
MYQTMNKTCKQLIKKATFLFQGKEDHLTILVVSGSSSTGSSRITRKTPSKC